MFDTIRSSISKPTNYTLSFGGGSLLVLATLAFAVPDANSQSAKFEFGILGDTDYSKKTEKELPKVIAEMNKANLAQANSDINAVRGGKLQKGARGIPNIKTSLPADAG